MARKGLLEGLPYNLPELEEPFPLCLLTKSTKIPRGPTIDVSKISPGFMLQIYFAFLNVKIICGLTSTLVDICAATSYPSGFPSRSKRPHLDILKFLVAILRNQEKKVAFVWVDEDGSLSSSSEFIKTCHYINIIVKATGGYAYSLNGKTESPNKMLGNIPRSLLLNSSHNK